MLVLVSLLNAAMHSLQIKPIGLAFGFGSKINKYLSFQAWLKWRFSPSILHLRLDRNDFRGCIIVLLLPILDTHFYNNVLHLELDVARLRRVLHWRSVGISVGSCIGFFLFFHSGVASGLHVARGPPFEWALCRISNWCCAMVWF